MRQCHSPATRDRVPPVPPPFPTCHRICVAASVTSHQRVKERGEWWGGGGGDKRGVGGYAAAAELARCSSVRDGATHFQVYGKYVYADGGLRARARL